MASIQILEIRPVEYEVEELSYDMTGRIVGGVGFDLDPRLFLECVSTFLSDLNTLGPIDAAAKFLTCLAATIGEV